LNRENGISPALHEEMEKVTIVLDGEITHEDSMGNIGPLSGRGCPAHARRDGIGPFRIQSGPETLHFIKDERPTSNVQRPKKCNESQKMKRNPTKMPEIPSV